MPYIKKTTRSGSLLEIEVYYAPNEGKRLARGTNTSQTVEAMVRENERNSQKRQKRLACANFSRKNGDLFVTLTFAQPVEEERVEKEIRNLLDRLRRLRKKKEPQAPARHGMGRVSELLAPACADEWRHHL